MSKQRVLVTGGSGFIGVHLIQLLLESSYQILNLDIKAPVNGENHEFWQHTSLLDVSAIRNSINDFDPHYIVHLAATTTQNAKSISEFEVNLQGTQNLVQIANTLVSLRKIFFTSTQYVNTPGHPFSINSAELIPYGLYGQSKLIGGGDRPTKNGKGQLDYH